MRRRFQCDRGKACSLVFTVAEQLGGRDDYGSPEPDFLRWVDKTLFVDVAIAGDEAAWDKLPAEEREAWRLFCTALEATGNLLELYRTNLGLFQRIAGQLNLLASFVSCHPSNPRFNRDLLHAAQLGRQNMDTAVSPRPSHLAWQSWPVRYAYAIIAVIDLTLDTYADRLPLWSEIYGYGVKHPVPVAEYESAMSRLGWDNARRQRALRKYEGSYRILPVWTKGLEKLRRPFNHTHVLDYWRVGKALVLEEMPDFHERPEWCSYHQRHYAHGAKAGAIQHAIFKDILAALRTIAGANKRPAARARGGSA